MLALRISTSRSARLWASEYWKMLLDAISQRGSKRDPRRKYRDLAAALSEIIEERDGRFHSKISTPLSALDDVSLKLMGVRRVESGNEAVELIDLDPPTTTKWQSIDFPYFGTIGDSKYEAQTKRNRTLLSDVFKPSEEPAWLGLAFELSLQRMSEGGRDRDVDNLADALMPFFNSKVRRFGEIWLIKLPPAPAPTEALRFCCRPLDDAPTCWRP